MADEHVCGPGPPRTGPGLTDPTPESPITTALVLSGGGAKGAFEAGVIAALEDADVDPTVVCGTSAGAIDAAAVACGIPVARLLDLWGSLDSGDVYRVRRDVHRLVRPLHLAGNPRALLGLGQHSTSEHLLDSIGWTWLFHLRPLRRRLVEVLRGEELPIRDGVALTVSCVDAATGALVRFTNRAPAGSRVEDDYLETTMTVDHVMRFGMVRDMDHVQTVNALARAAPDATPHREVELVPVVPGDADRSGLGELLDFHAGRARQLIAHGREEGAAAIRRWRDGVEVREWDV